MDMFSYTKKLNTNIKRISYAYEIANSIRICFDDIRRGLAKYAGWMKNPEQVKKFEDVGLLANQKNLSRPAKIVYKYSKEEKIGEYEEHFDLIQDDLKAEKEARSILELSTRKITVISTDYLPLKEKVVLLTDQDAHKDTAETLTEIIRPKTEESVTEIINKKIIVPQNNLRREIISESKEIVSRPREEREYLAFYSNGKEEESTVM